MEYLAHNFISHRLIHGAAARVANQNSAIFAFFQYTVELMGDLKLYTDKMK